MENSEKTIIKTSLKTLAILVGVLVFVVGILCIFFPRVMSNFSASLGFNNLSFYFARVQYEKSNNINDLHTLIYSATDINNDEAIIKYSEILFNQTNYAEFIDYINDLNAQTAPNNIAKISLTNENNYLKNKYVKSLCQLDQFAKACSFVELEMLNSISWASPSRTSWQLNHLLLYQANQTTHDYTFLTNNISGQSNSLIYYAETFIAKLLETYNLYKSDIESLSTEQSFEYAVLKNDIHSYISHLIFLENKIDLELHSFDYYKTTQQNL